MKLVLFDIDGTLILSGGAGMRAFRRALAEVFALPAEDVRVHPDGKTDSLIAKEFLAHFDRLSLWNEQACESLFSSYLSHLEEEVAAARTSGALRILPGVKELLELIASRSDFALGLVTGNLEEGARIKLEGAGLDRYFSFGGYGSDSEDRTALTRIGIERGRRWIAPAVAEEVFVVGDTPLDVIHGRAAGARIIAVASARYSVTDLDPYRPDLLLPDLGDVRAVLAFLEQKSGSGRAADSSGSS